MIRVAVDAMGGDFAPAVAIDGALDAVRCLPKIDKLILVGDQAVIEKELAARGGKPAKIEIFHASEAVGMDESPALAIRRKKDSSISRAIELVRAGEAEAFFSAGNTGAVVAAATLKLRTIEGVERPAIATIMPTMKTPFVLIDSGGNTDCTPTLLVQFAAMGVVYSREILGQANPSVGLLNIGGEQLKGNETTKETFRLLGKGPFNFSGNVEGHDLFEGKVDVVVCDGFVGNVVLKTSESVAHVIGHWLKEELMSSLWNKIAALMLRKSLMKMKSKSDPSAHGGAPLLGVNGVVIIGHGSSNRFAIMNGIRVACEAVNHNINHHIQEEVARTDHAISAN